jgi:hypothetical protein
VVSEAYVLHQRNERDRQQPAFNASWMLADLLKTANWGTFKSDNEVPPPYKPDAEPVPAIKDSWARGAGETWVCNCSPGRGPVDQCPGLGTDQGAMYRLGVTAFAYKCPHKRRASSLYLSQVRH